MVIKEKEITRTFRNANTVFEQVVILRLESALTEGKLQVTEMRKGFKNSKVVFYGDKVAAEKFFAESTSSTLVSTHPASPRHSPRRS